MNLMKQNTFFNFIPPSIVYMRYWHLIFLMLLFPIIAQAQNQTIAWSKMYGLPDADSSSANLGALSFAPTTDGGFILTGFVRSGTVNWCDFGNDTLWGNVWVAKCDATGNILWQRCFGGSEVDTGVDILQEPDGGYTLLATTFSNDGDVSGNHSTAQDFWLVRLDNDGNLLWQKCYGGNNSEIAKRLIRTSLGMYVIMGSSNSYPSGDVGNHHGDVFNYDLWVVVTDSNGVLFHEYSFGGSDLDGYASILYELEDKNLLIGLTTYSTDGDVQVTIHGFNDLWLLKVDTTLNIIWQKSKGGNGGESAGDVYESNGLYYFSAGTGSTDGFFSANQGGSDVWLLVTDTNGNTIDQFLYGGSLDESGTTIDLINKHFYIGTESYSYDGDVGANYGKNDYWLLITDTAGNLLDEMNYGGSGEDNFVNGKSILLNDRLLLLGFSNSIDYDVEGDFNGVGGSWLVALDLVSGILQPEFRNTHLKVVPNPFFETAQLVLPETWNSDITGIELFDMQGRLLQQYRFDAETAILDRGNLPSGIYLLKVFGQSTWGCILVSIE